ncbi:MAG: ABC transporter ATP-binding protein [Candidatus Nanopelagicales bacterium]|nr:ABC transporter ATP-binding protein [Candidatus Nanopelagicales bacterium]
MDGPATALRLQGLTKFYGSQRGIEDLSLDVKTGEVFGFLGPNGAGKTTTIRMILGLLHPTDGTGEVLGFDIVKDSVALRANTGYLPGDLALYDRMTGRDLLEFLSRMRGGVPRQRYEELAERLHLDLSRRVKDLSRGNRQKIGVVAAFMHSPQLLVLDEPTSGLDPLVQQEFQRLVRETVEGGAWSRWPTGSGSWCMAAWWSWTASMSCANARPGASNWTSRPRRRISPAPRECNVWKFAGPPRRAGLPVRPGLC